MRHHIMTNALLLAALAAGALAITTAACGATESDENATGDTTGSAAGGAGGTGSGGGSGGFVPNGSGGFGGQEACHVENAVGERKELDILVAIDRSGSMAGSLWNGSVSALTSFFQDSASQGIRAGLSFFPPEIAPDACDPNAYNPPTVPLEQLPTNASVLVNAMNATTPAGNATPMYGALYGSLQWASLHQDMNSDRVVVLVFASDGDPTECNTNIGAIAQVAATAFGYNGLRTYLVAIQGATVSNLDQIAAAGGTGQAIDVTTNVSLLQQALEDIRGEVLGCEFDIPQPVNEEFDATKVNVEYAPDDMQDGTPIPQVANAGDCGSMAGWYYDNPTTPTKVMLCPASCTDVQNNPSAVITFAFGCPTIVR